MTVIARQHAILPVYTGWIPSLCCSSLSPAISTVGEGEATLRRPARWLGCAARSAFLAGAWWSRTKSSQARQTAAPAASVVVRAVSECVVEGAHRGLGVSLSLPLSHLQHGRPQPHVQPACAVPREDGRRDAAHALHGVRVAERARRQLHPPPHLHSPHPTHTHPLITVHPSATAVCACRHARLGAAASRVTISRCETPHALSRSLSLLPDSLTR